jgi:hypothetical protein
MISDIKNYMKNCPLLWAITICVLVGLETGVERERQSGQFRPGRESAEKGRAETGTAEKLPAGLDKSGWKGIIEAHEEAKYAITRQDKGWQGWNPGQQWVTKFDGRGFLTRPETIPETRPESGREAEANEWRWGLELESYGTGVREKRVRGRAGDVSVAGEEVRYHWNNRDGRGVEEWYLNNRKGLEHGYRINESQGEEDEERLQLTLAVKGTLIPERSEDGRGITFRKRDGGAVINYGGLKVWDAKGRDLEARFEEAGEERIRLVIDVWEAIYPITVDPLAQQAYLKASNAEAGDSFGYSVAISGQTVVVGAIGEASSATGGQSDNSASNAGAAYV